MCYRLVERYSVCGCVYYEHAVDRCASYSQAGHKIQERTILVGYACANHSPPPQGSYRSDKYTYSDSGYYSGQSHRSSKKPSSVKCTVFGDGVLYMARAAIESVSVLGLDQLSLVV